jgi:hypothetical protein
MNDPILNRTHLIMGTNVNNQSIPVIRSLLTQTLGEFMPDVYAELRLCSPSTQAAALRVYECIRQRVEGKL